jgi:hypothetical protein
MNTEPIVGKISGWTTVEWDDDACDWVEIPLTIHVQPEENVWVASARVRIFNDQQMAEHDRELREQIAKDIEASDADWHPVAYREGKYSAATIARGDQHD